MRDIIKLVLTLAVVGILSASLLTGVNAITAPIIVERQEREYLEAIRQYFPDMAEFKTEPLDGDSVDLIYGPGGVVLGVIGTFSQAGFEGPIIYNLVVSAAGEILGIRVISHSETPGIGDVIAQEDFERQFVGKSHRDPIQAGVDVDIITGATVSTAAMIVSVRQSLAVITENFLDLEDDSFDITSVPDGTYRGSAMGYNDEILVEVTVLAGRIIEIIVLENSETPTRFIEAYPAVPERIIETQSLDVDTRTGATISGDAIIQAVLNALQKGLESDPDDEADTGGGDNGE